MERVGDAIADISVELVELPPYVSQHDEVAREWSAAAASASA